MAGEGETRHRLEEAARWTPLLILAYFAAQFAIRVTLSGNLETDEAQFVGQTYLALGYNNSHPPLYNWLVAGALAITGGYWPAALALIKNLLLAGTYLLSFDIARRVTGRALTGLIVVASFMLLPQIVWKSQVTLAHSVLVMFAVVAIMHAVVTVAERGRIGGFVWLGIAAAIGALAKYNLFLMLAAMLLAAFSVPSIRTRLFTPRLAVSFAILALLTAPHFWWAVQHLGETTQRLEKLDRENPAFTALDLPFLGIDGVLDLALAIAAWGGPLLAVWFALRHLSRKEDSAPAATDEKRVGDFGRLFGRTAMIGLGVFAGIVLFGDLHSVQERYLTPVLMPLPFWLAFSWPLEMRPRASLRFIGAGAVIAGLMVTAWPLWIVFGREQFAYPYAAVAEALAGAIPGPFTVLAPHDKFGANIAIRLDRAKRWEGGPPPDQVVILWEPKNGRTPRGLIARLGDGFEPRSDVMTLNYPYENLSGQEAQLNAQLYARKP